jgi:uncharacterized membrane protein
MATSSTSKNSRVLDGRLNRFVYWLSRNWLPAFTLLLVAFVGLPWLAPLFMKMGWNRAAEFIYVMYASQCHQLPQRSFFLFGTQSMYSLPEVQDVFQATNDPAILRQFIGNPDMGWKVAWSDRMVSMYGSLLFFSAIYWPFRKRVKPLRWTLVALLLLPMLLDGGTHMISDLTGGIGAGFRDSNEWLAAITANRLPATFYAGDALGSFNSWMRLISGLFFGFGLTWWAFPHLHNSFSATAREIEAKLDTAGQSS